MNVSSLFSSMMRAFDDASRADQARMMEQSTRLTQARRAQEAHATTMLPRVEQPGDGFEVVRRKLVSLG